MKDMPQCNTFSKQVSPFVTPWPSQMNLVTQWQLSWAQGVSSTWTPHIQSSNCLSLWPKSLQLTLPSHPLNPLLFFIVALDAQNDDYDSQTICCSHGPSSMLQLWQIGPEPQVLKLPTLGTEHEQLGKATRSFPISPNILKMPGPRLSFEDFVQETSRRSLWVHQRRSQTSWKAMWLKTKSKLQ